MLPFDGSNFLPRKEMDGGHFFKGMPGREKNKMEGKTQIEKS